MPISKEILDELIKDYKNSESLLGEQGLLKQLTKAPLERAMQAELTHDLRYGKHDRQASKESLNQRNGSTSKTVKSKSDPFALFTRTFNQRNPIAY